MNEQTKFCPQCGAPLEPGVKFCSACGCSLQEAPAPAQPEKKKKPLYKRWWFWLIVVIVVGQISLSVLVKSVTRALAGTSRPAVTATAAPTATPKPTATPAPTPAAAPEAEETAEEAAASEETPAPTEAPAEKSDGISPEFRATMESYEAFFDEYVEFMQKYAANPTSTALLMDYMNYLTAYSEAMEKLENLDTSKLNNAELALYTETMARISSKLLKAVG